MRTVNVGRSGLRVSQICLGTMVFGSQRDELESFAILDRAAELGIDFIDAADAYPVPPSPETWGRTEEIVGKWLQARYNLLNRTYERDLLPLARAAGLGVVPYNPLAAGMLTGKYRRDMEPPADSR